MYDNEDLFWTRTSFVQPQIMLHDRFLYDRETGSWTVDKYLQDLKDRYGGIDSVLLWQGYPNIGIDDRNQFDMLKSLPGGIEGIRQLTNDFLRNGVKVLLPYLPWDQGTRQNEQDDIVSLVDIIIRSNISGMNGDTMDGVNGSFWQEALLNDYPMAIEPEVMYSNYQYLTFDTMSWGYWTNTVFPPLNPLVPPVSSYKAMTENKHLHHICERWATDRTDGLQYAFFNGAGYESWENVWGIFNQFTERDGEALRRIATILREFGDFLQGGSTWTPHIPVIKNLNSKAFVSEFRTKDQVIWLMVNRDRKNDEKVELVLPLPEEVGETVAIWYDLYHGISIDEWLSDNGVAKITIEVEASGFGAIMVQKEGNFANEEFMQIMNELSKVPLRNYSSDWTFLPQTQEPLEVYESQSESSKEMVEVPGGELFFNVQGNAIEGDEVPFAVDVQYPWEDSPRRHHVQTLQIPTLLVDKYPVTNVEYQDFLHESNWIPDLKTNWLREWNEDGSFPDGFETKPVVWLSHQDATVYCNYYGKRLPHSWEWQWFAQGPDGRPYPWGYQDPDETRIPKFTNGRVHPPADNVDAHPLGASWCGIEDLVGNVYQWTDVFTDEHTSRAVLRGSPHWRPSGSHWYQPYPNTALSEHNTYLLMSEGMDRNGGTGFRCVQESA